MSIEITYGGGKLTQTAIALYTAPVDCISATILGGTVTSTNQNVAPNFALGVNGGRSLSVVPNGQLPFLAGPVFVPVTTLAPGETYFGFTDANGEGYVDVLLTIGVQR